MFHHINSLKEYTRYPVSTAIIVINVLLFIATLIIGDSFYVDYGLIPGKEGEWYRILTSAFLHGGFMHLLMNMFCIFIIGPVIERKYKNIVYIILYLLFAITSGLVVYQLGSGLTVGASGAIYAMFGFCYILADKLLLPQEKKSLGSLIIINVVLSFFIPNVSIIGHIGGLVSGAAIGFVIKKL